MILLLQSGDYVSPLLHLQVGASVLACGGDGGGADDDDEAETFQNSILVRQQVLMHPHKRT